MAVYSNIVKKDKLRKVQKETLQTIKDALTCSFGPYGSNTLVYKDATLNTYTKDGHDIMKGIKNNVYTPFTLHESKSGNRDIKS